MAAASDADKEFLRYVAENPVVPGRATIIGRPRSKADRARPDVLEDPEFTWFEAQAKGKPEPCSACRSCAAMR